VKIQSLVIAEVFASLLSRPEGLTSDEAQRRLAEYGPNELREEAHRSLLRRLTAHLTHFLALLLWLAAGLCFLSEYLHPGEGMLRLGIAILAVILINALFSFIQEYRTEKALEELRKLLPFRVSVVRDGQQREIDARQLVPGDLVLLQEGDKVPADGRVVLSNRLTVNNAPLTGESDARTLSAEPMEQELLESRNLVFAGTLVVGGSGRMVVYATAMATEFGKIAHITGRVVEAVSPLQVEISRATRVVALIAVAAGICFFLLGAVIGRGFWNNFLFAVGIIIALVPEGMLPTVTLALAMGSQRMARRNALVKSLNAVEALGSVDLICTDKTGTLTQNRMAVKQLWSPGDEQMACTVALLCNNAVASGEELRGDPTETALYRFARQRVTPAAQRLDELPFDAERKRMATLHRVDGQLLVLVKGAGESVLPLCSSMRAGSAIMPISSDTAVDLAERYRDMAAQGLRVMALAYRPLETAPESGIGEEALVLAGFVGLEDPPRPEVAPALASCRSAGIRVVMVTGDAGPTAAAVGREIGLVSGEPLVIEGRQCAAMPDAELWEAVQQGNVVFARMSPQNKMHLVSLLMAAGHRVAVTGDGVNDAPALKKAHVGIAMGLSGTSVAREAADIVLLDDNFASIVHAIEEGRTVFENIRNFITYIFASNIPELIPYLCYVLFGIPLPLTIMQILAVDLGTDLVPALALGSERPGPAIMQRPPRSSGERLLTRGVLLRAYLFLGMFEALAGMTAYLFVMQRGGWSWPQTVPPATPFYLQATTACLAGIIVTQLANVFTCRSPDVSLATMGLFSNRLVLVGIMVELLLAAGIIYTPLGNAIFGCLPLDGAVWLLLVPFALLLLGADELRKLVVRRRTGMAAAP
jgi:sodium/potassium-transporting ATPase subunit alpha